MFPADSATYSDWIGFLGVAIYVFAYLLLQIGVVRGSGFAYPVMNLIAALMVLVGLSSAFNWSSAALQVIWVVISLVGIIRLYILHSSLNFSDEEQTLIAHGLPRMAKPTARKLLNRGEWMDAEPGTVLTAENECVTHLHFILTGGADVTSGGTSIAELSRGFVGEMNVMEAAPASATVTISRPSRMFTVSGTALRNLVETDPDFASSLSVHLAKSTKEKLIEANRRLTAPGA